MPAATAKPAPATSGLNGRTVCGPAITTEVVEVTPEQANAWLVDSRFENQRERRAWHVEQLAEAIETGEFLPTPIMFAVFNGHEFLIDGQHRLAAIVAAGRTVPLIVVREWVAREEDILTAYGRIDSFLKRTQGEALVARRIPERVGVEVKDLTRVVAAVKVLMGGFGTRGGHSAGSGTNWRKYSADHMTRGIEQWQEEARAYLKALSLASHGQRRRLLNATPFALGMVTYRYQAEKAEEFWTLVAEQSGLIKNSGPWWANDILSNEKMTPINIASRRLATAWNVFFEARVVTRLYVQQGLSGGIVIAGTPYRKDRVIRESFDLSEG